MAVVVGGLGVPHTPFFPGVVARDGPKHEIARFFAVQRAALTRMKPDLIVVFDTDHFNTFFIDNLPTFAVGVDKTFVGPIDEPEALPLRTLKSDEPFAAHIRKVLIESEFDPSLLTHYGVDHSVMVPLHFLDPKSRIPVIPIFINGHMPPEPSAARCLKLGKAVRKAIDAWKPKARVVVMGSGSFSLDVMGYRMDPGRSDGVPDLAWSRRVQKLMVEGKVNELVRRSTAKQLWKAGNVGGELLNWIAMLGVIGNRKATHMQDQGVNGHAYGIWEWE
jgi:hypothetical protein